LAAIDAEFVGLIKQITSLEVEQQELTRELSSYGAGTQASMQELLQQLEQHRASLRAAQDRLQDAMEGDLALALAGRPLREAAIVRLRQEERREQWETGRAQGDSRLAAFLEALREALTVVEPPLLYDQREVILSKVETAWDRLWNPPDSETAPEYKHTHIRGAERVETRARLERIASSGARLRQNLDEIAAHERDIERLQDEVNRTEGLTPDLDKKRRRLQDVTRELGPLHQRKGALENELTGVKSQLEQKRKELGRLRQQRGTAAPGLRRAAIAEKVAALLDDIIRDAVPSQIEAVAEAMTKAYRSMAHKGAVERVQVDEDCTVRLLTGRGRDMREVEPSAGEKQIFSLALISAVLSVSERDFPMVVDTPLGRLDRTHSLALLRQLTDQPRQVILLSTDTEVVGDALEEIRPRISKAYLLHHEHDGDIGLTRAEPGYFEGQQL
jgi:DNA sulfur modification protein DndD